MNLSRYFHILLMNVFFLCTVVSCSNKKKNNSATIAESPAEMQEKSVPVIQAFLDKIASTNGELDSGIVLRRTAITKFLYEKNAYEPLWCSKQEWLPAGDSLYNFITRSKLFGLFPEDYFADSIGAIRKTFIADSLSEGARKEVNLWTKADIMLTNAFVQIVKDVKLGRLPKDSITLRKDTLLSNDFYYEMYAAAKKAGTITAMAEKLEPTHKGYYQLKAGIRNFLESYDTGHFTFVPSKKDLIKFNQALQQRLFEGGYISFAQPVSDSVQLAEAVKKFQKEKGITVDGKAGEGTVRLLNSSDKEKFARIAISMDRYKMLPETMPERYVWVNAASNLLEVVDGGKVVLSSRVICGKANTRTPVLTSVINSLITYPQWVPPPSIVSKEILPAVKRNPGYLAKKGFTLVNSKGETVDPYSVDWSKYSKGVPFRIVQGSGDANALGIMKFVFDNKYSVYLHDTNQRYLFSNSMRSLSHGCVRVQDWEKLAKYILSTDSIRAKGGSYTRIDSMQTWLSNKQKRSIPIKNKLPVYIRYITCEGKDGVITFYDDVYAEDKLLREKYFAVK